MTKKKQRLYISGQNKRNIRQRSKMLRQKKAGIRMKKWITGALAILLGVMSIAVPFSGMHIAEAKTTEETDRKLNIVTTIFPEYDWTRNILGKRM